VDTSLAHPVVGIVGDALGNCTRCVGVGENSIAFLNEGQCKEGGTDLVYTYKVFGEKKRIETVLTSVVIPAIMICFLPVARTASRNSLLSQASTSPLRLIKGALGCISITSLGRGPFGPVVSDRQIG